MSLATRCPNVQLRDSLLKRKDQYAWPPWTISFKSPVFILKIFLFFTKQAILTRRSIVQSLTLLKNSLVQLHKEEHSRGVFSTTQAEKLKKPISRGWMVLLSAEMFSLICLFLQWLIQSKYLDIYGLYWVPPSHRSRFKFKIWLRPFFTWTRISRVSIEQGVVLIDAHWIWKRLNI
jgi:hypothetical protein